MDRILHSRVGLACCVVAAVAAATVGNLMVNVAYRFQDSPELQNPAGWEWVERVVGFVWLGLFACMGTASWLAYNGSGPNASRNGRLIVGLLVVCLLYPVYTLGMQAVPGLIANVAVLVLAVAVAASVRSSSPVVTGLVLPVVVWVALATVYTAKLVGIIA